MKKAARLKGKKEFDTVFTEGRSWANNFVVIRAVPNSSGVNRYGIVAGRRLGGAVVRNKAKRRLRAAVSEIAIREGWDIVLVARKAAVETDYHTLEKAVRDLFARARLLGEDERAE
ncbi:MAG: ribonuclease P protein component [Dehalococcoidia bacterium]|jgi:ribonuclease P protein component